MADSSDNDNIPLAYLREADLKETSEDDITLNQLQKRRTEFVESAITDVSEDDCGEIYDSDKDAQFNLGACEVGNCRKEVWSACPMCEILTCFDHSNEDISSCNQHRNADQKRKKRNRVEAATSKPHSPTKDQGPSVVQSNPTQLCADSNEQPEQFTVEGSAKEVTLQRTKKTNKQVEAKAKRNKGEEYINPSTKKKVLARELKPRCKGSAKCGKKCDAITDDQRQKIFRAYYELGDLRLQREYIVRHIAVSGIKRQRVKNGQPRRKITKNYSFTMEDQQKIPVCQTFFLNTLSISDQKTRTALSKTSPTGTLEDEKRGGRQSEAVITRDKMIEEAVKNHINRFPRVESHFCRSSTSREYLSSDLTISKMYDMFKKDWHPNPNPPTLRYYEKTFKQMNLSIHRPKKDQCSLCMHVSESRRDENIQISEELKKRYEMHIAEKKKVRELKDVSSKMARENEHVRCATFDLQQVIYLPQSQESSIFYKRRLSNYNLTFYDITRKSCHCFTWHEGVSRRGASEISSAVYQALQLYDNDGVKEVYMYSDGCAGQNKNSIMPAMMLYTVMNSNNLHEISLRFFETNHGQNEGDSVHSSISGAMKRAGNLFVPSQLTPVFSLARRNNVVHQLQVEDFIDFKLLSQDLRILNSRRYSEDGVVNWNTIMELKVTKMYPDRIFYKTSHLADAYSDIILKRLKENYLTNYVLKNLNTEPNKVSKEKYQDLISLCSGDVPVIRNQEHKDLYFQLPHHWSS